MLALNAFFQNTRSRLVGILGITAVVGGLVLTLTGGDNSATATEVTGPLPVRPMGAVADDYPTGEACASRIAIQIEFGSFCTEVCVTDAQCLENWGCKTLVQGNGSSIGLCTPRRILPSN
jgi:hypothetical protein